MNRQTHGDPPLRDFGTALLRTRVYSRGQNSHEWVREPGPEAPEPFAATSTSLLPMLARLSVPDAAEGIRLAVGVQSGGARRYRVTGTTSAAGLLLSAPPSASLAVTLNHLGRLLRAIHDVPLDQLPKDLDPPRPVRRLHRWMDTGEGPARAVAAHDVLRTRLGGRLWKHLQGAARDRSARDLVLAHGAPGLGSVVLDPQEERAFLLTGEDIGLASWRHDVGWVCGELVELAWQTGAPLDGWRPLLASFTTGYGHDPGPETPTMAALRIILHVHDFSAYTDAPTTVAQSYADFIAHLLREVEP